MFYLLPKDLVSVLEVSNQLVFSLDLDDFLLNTRKDSTAYSEIEGSLSIEGVPTTRKRMTKLLQKGAEPTCRNDTIIKNMSLGLKFISERPLFNEGNLASLYEILSKGCLDEEDRLKEGEIYRYDEVEADQYFGCPHSEIRQCMDSLFAFVNANLDNAKLRPFLPSIAHYYLLYSRPYFDCNGRTARTVSLWLGLLAGSFSPSLISEAIDFEKKDYYLSLKYTRDCGNDLTYFFGIHL